MNTAKVQVCRHVVAERHVIFLYAAGDAFACERFQRCGGSFCLNGVFRIHYGHGVACVYSLHAVRCHFKTGCVNIRVPHIKPSV